MSRLFCPHILSIGERNLHVYVRLVLSLTICSDCTKELLQRILQTQSTSDILSFLCFLVNVPHEEHVHFQTTHPKVMLSSAGHPPTLVLRGVSGGHTEEGERGEGCVGALSLDAVERTVEHIMQLLQSVLQTEGLVGTFFTECFNHLADAIAVDSKIDLSTQKTAANNSERGDDNSHQSSSVLLDCERLLPPSSSEVAGRTSALYVTAALCEHQGAKVIAQSPLPSLLTACGKILAGHARVMEERERARKEKFSLTEERGYDEAVLGGHVTLSLVFGLLSAVMAGARKV